MLKKPHAGCGWDIGGKLPLICGLAKGNGQSAAPSKHSSGMIPLLGEIPT